MSLIFRQSFSRKFLLPIVLMWSLLLLSLTPAVASVTDTIWSAYFRVNMSRAVSEKIFRPDSDFVYLVMDQGIAPVRLVPEPGNIYSINLDDLTDTAATFTFRFRINDSLAEQVSRTITMIPGLASYRAWWNNDPASVTHYDVNMKFAVQNNLFDPAVDSVMLTGTMNEILGQPVMTRRDTTLHYQFTDTISDPGTIYSYKFRINADSSGLELPGQPPRLILVTDTILTVASDFSNFNPARLPMTFRCNMGYYIRSDRFDPAVDFVDVAGNFNGDGAHDVLFDPDHDSIYTLDLYLDTAWISQGPLTFRFRINGWAGVAELAGKPDRSYAFHDTIQQGPNVFSCYFNDLDPAVPAPPVATNLAIQGLLIYKKFLTGSYTYENINGIPEGISAYRWLRSDNAQGDDAVAIDSAWEINYTVDTLDIGKWLVFEVVPKAITGDSATGRPVRIVSSGSISQWDVGIPDHERLEAIVFPNPASDEVQIVARKTMRNVRIINLAGEPLVLKDGLTASAITLRTRELPAGFYLILITAADGSQGVYRLLKH